MYAICHFIFIFWFMMHPLMIEPKNITDKNVLFYTLGKPHYRYDAKGFIAWEKHDGYLYSAVEYRKNNETTASNIYLANNIQLLKNTKSWNGVELHQCVTVWPYGRFCRAGK